MSAPDDSGRWGAILQPSYLPWLGCFDQMAAVDTFVFLDDVQYTKQDWRNRNRVLSAASQGWTWLTVPVHRPASRTRICEVEIDYAGNWAARHLNVLAAGYRRTPFFEPVYTLVADELGRRPPGLAALNIALTRALAGYMGIARPTWRASDLAVADTDRNGRLIDLCRKAGIAHFYDGSKARCFIDTERFARAGIGVSFQDYVHPVYPQGRRPFVPYLSVVDLLFGHGPKAAAVLACHPRARRRLGLAPAAADGGRTVAGSG